MQFTTPSKNIKYLGTNLTEDMQYLSRTNFKTTVIKDVPNYNGVMLWTQHFKEISLIPNLINEFNAIPIKTTIKILQGI